MTHELKPRDPVYEFANKYSIDITADMGPNTHLTPRLAELDETGATSQHISDGGADFFFTRLDYCDGEVVRASRMIGVIPPGMRTELAYWTEAAPAKDLAVHQGKGVMVVGNPQDGTTNVFQLDPEVTKKITLPSGRFYTLEAAAYTEEPLVVSGFYEAPFVDWSKLEVVVSPGDSMVATPGGIIEVPEEFRIVFRG